MTILVTGGTGSLGTPTVERLRRAGHAVRVLSRSAGDGRVTGNLATGEGLSDALSGVDTVVHLATSVSTKDIAHTSHLVEAAQAAGVAHLVYISIVGVDRIPYGYYRAKLASEKVIEESGIPFTILRATQFHSFVAMLPASQKKMPFITAVNIPDQPIAVEEVAQRLTELVAEGPQGRVADIGGPEQLTLRTIIDTWQKAHGTHKPVLMVPVAGRLVRSLRAGDHMPGVPSYGTVTFAAYAESEAAK
jgi:uncharacterized protein YbjT (DUF2867 family)